MKRIICYCTTCEYWNRQYLGVPGYEWREPKMVTLTEALQHMDEHQDSIHYVEIREEEDDNKS